MDNRLLARLIFIASLVALSYSVEDGLKDAGKNDSAYDLNGLVEKTADNLRNSLKVEQFSELNFLKFRGLDESIPFQPMGNLLQNSSKCLADILYIFQNIKSQWALKMIDSFGKPESGIFRGNFRWLGDYDECLSVESTNPNSTTVGNFRGKYCSVSLNGILGNLSPLPLPVATSVCIPDSCSAEILKEDVVQLLHIAGVVPVLNGTNSGLSANSLTCKERERHLNGPAKGVIVLLSIFFALAVLGSSLTAVQYFLRILNASKKGAYIVQHDTASASTVDSTKTSAKEREAMAPVEDESLSGGNVYLQKVESVLKCFCVFTNGSKILNTDASKGELLCIHGIRFLSMSWVIQGHAYLFGVNQMSNTLALPDLMRNFPFQIVLQGFYSVDSFFVLSGFLLTYLTMKEFDRTKGRLPWAYFYIHRYIRLTPSYMMVLAFYATVFLYIGSGPYWVDNDVDPTCKTHWWRNLIYINNFSDVQCVSWSWYLANDMQFFIISPLFLITLWRWPKIGYSLIGVFLVASCICNFVITYHFDLPGGFSAIMSDLSLSSLASLVSIQDYMNKIYFKPYTRIGPYLLGIVTGHLLYLNKTIHNRKHSLVFLSVGWLVASVITLTCFFGMYHAHPSTLANSFYNAFNRSGFALGLCWVIYVCLMDQGGFVNTLLSYRGFIPLSRLTYAAYLIHPMVLTGYFLSLKSALEFSHLTIVMLYLGFMVVTYGLSLPVALILESPIVGLEKLVRNSFTKKEKPETVN